MPIKYISVVKCFGHTGRLLQAWKLTIIALISWASTSPRRSNILHRRTPMLPKAVGIIIPAHNEETELPDCLETVQLACEYASQSYPELQIRVIVVADAC